MTPDNALQQQTMTTPAHQPTFKRTIFARACGVRIMLDDMVGALTEAGVPQKTRSDLQIVMAEILNNISQHAYCEQEPGPVRVTIDKTNDRIVCKIEDCGAALPDEKLPSGALPDNAGPVDSLPENGFGWFLIRSMTSQVVYQRDHDVNRLLAEFSI